MTSDAQASDLSEYVGYRLNIFLAVFIPLQIVAVVLRFWARSIRRGSYGADDWLVVVSLICQMVACGIGIGKSSRQSNYEERHKARTADR
jgi:hypothetical protein